MLYRYILVFAFLLPNLFFAQANLDSLIHAGINKSYHFDFKEAEKLFNEAIELSPENPKGYHYLSQIYLWYYLGSKDEGSLGIFNRYSDIAQSKADMMLQNNSDDYEMLNLMGDIYRFKSMVSASSGSSLSAFWDAKAAVGYFEEALEINPEYYDAYLGLGFFKYALSFVPGFFKWAISLTGLSGDKDEGVDFLELAYEKGSKSKIEAAFHLGKVYTEYLGDYKSAGKYLNEITDLFPDNSLFVYQNAILKIEQRKLNEASELLNIIIKQNQKKFQQTLAFSLFLKAEINFKLNKFVESIKYYDEFIDSTRGIDYTGIANLNKAFCYLMINDEMEARRSLILARNGNMEILDDMYAKEKSEFMFRSIPNSSELNIIKAWNSMLAGNYSSASALINSVSYNTLSNEYKGRCRIIEAETFLAKGNFDEALKKIFEALKLDFKYDEWIIPYSYYLAAKSHYSNNNVPKAEEYILLAEKNNLFNLKDKIEPRINFIINKLFAE